MAAQDVTSTPVTALDSTEAPDVLPVARRSLDPSFPAELRTTADLGYVVVELYVPETDARPMHKLFGTLDPYGQAVREQMELWSFQPARRAGRPSGAFVRVAFVFNPASANPSAPDATPRLRDPAIVVDPARAARAETSPPQVIWATATVSATGQLTSVEGVPDDLRALLEPGLPAWKFDPARRAGVAVEAKVSVPFILVAPGQTMSVKGTPPRLVKSVPPVYPPAMRKSGLSGDVALLFTVTAKGTVEDVMVQRSLNPALDRAAVDAVQQWTFEPAIRGGVPASAPVRISVSFSLRGEPGGGTSGIAVGGVDQSKLPPEYRYDVAPKPRGMVLPVYPYALMAQNARGKARVRFVIGTNGRVLNAEVMAADRPEFGAALKAAVECYEFEPALRGGRPTRTMLDTEQVFSTYNQDGLVAHVDRALLATEREHPERIVAASRLDAQLAPVTRRAPVFPVSARGRVEKGEAVVEFIVDEEGSVRLPRVISATAPDFGFAALQASRSWRFTPAKSGGKSALVRVRVPFEFAGPPVVAH